MLDSFLSAGTADFRFSFEPRELKAYGPQQAPSSSITVKTIVSYAVSYVVNRVVDLNVNFVNNAYGWVTDIEVGDK